MTHLYRKLSVSIVKLTIAIVILVYSQAYITNTLADDFNDGIAAADDGDFSRALKLWLPLANSGNVNAQFNIGWLYSSGKGVEQNFKIAAEWYKVAAKQGLAEAQLNLGTLYAKGHGVSQDYKAAFQLYKLAAEQGNIKAQANLGAMYAEGTGVIQNFIKAYMWSTIASIEGDTSAKHNRDLVAKKMSPDQIATSQELASKCLKSNYKDCD